MPPLPKISDIAAARSLVVLALSALLAATATLADAADAGDFSIRTVFTEIRDGVIYLNADVNYELSEIASEALASGVDLTIELQIEVVRDRRLWVDRDVASLLQRYQLSYQPLSDRFVTRNLNSGNQMSFAALPAALEHLGRVRDLPLLDDALLRPGKRYEIRLRALLDTRDLAGPLRMISFFWGDWRLESEWYEWPLQL